jgi:hypothetical protein
MDKPQLGAALCRAVAAGLFALVLPGLGRCQNEDSLATLVKTLGNPKFAERDKARRQLETIGVPALGALRAGCNSDDLETNSRCQELIKKLEDKLAAEALLRPSMLRMSLTDVTALEALDDLQKQSGYQILFIGDRGPLAKRKFSIETGEVTFWQAFDRVCELGKLTQISAPAMPPFQAATVSGNVLLGQMNIQIQPLPAPPVRVGPVRQPQLPIKAIGMPQVQAQPVPVGAQPGQIQILQGVVQAQPGQMKIRPLQGSMAMNPPSVIVVQAGVSETIPTSLSGAIRMRLLPAASPQFAGVQMPKAGEAYFVVEVAGEPKLDQFSVVGSPRVTKAIDEHGQSWNVAPDPPGGGNHLPGVYGPNPLFQHSWLALEMGHKKADFLHELAGTVTIRALEPAVCPFIVVDNVLSATGKPSLGHGGSINIVSIAKQADGSFKATLVFERPPDHYAADPPSGPAKAAVVQPPAKANATAKTAVIRPISKGVPLLVDADGNALQLTQIPERLVGIFNGLETHQMTMIFKAGPGVGEPAKMVLFGYRMVTAEVPFRFEDVRISPTK